MTGGCDYNWRSIGCSSNRYRNIGWTDSKKSLARRGRKLSRGYSWPIYQISTLFKYYIYIGFGVFRYDRGVFLWWLRWARKFTRCCYFKTSQAIVAFTLNCCRASNNKTFCDFTINRKTEVTNGAIIPKLIKVFRKLNNSSIFINFKISNNLP